MSKTYRAGAPKSSKPKPDLKIVQTQVFRGPNYWSYEPCIRMLVDLGSLEEWPSHQIPGFNEGLLALLPGVAEHSCSLGRRGGFGERSPFQKVFFEGALHELLVDMALETRWGEPQPTGAALGAVDQLLAKGFARLRGGVGATPAVNWASLQRLAELP